jgi:cytoskeletal protein CcmA (bactofilin family)
MFRKRGDLDPEMGYMPERREVPPRLFEGQQNRVTPMRPPVEAYPQEEESFPNLVANDEPDAILAEGICVTGQLKFERYLRIDGEFEGEILSDGKIVVGPNGVVRSNLNLTEAIIEGRVEGNIIARERVELRGQAKVFGNVETTFLSVDEGVTLVGQVAVKPTADTNS